MLFQILVSVFIEIMYNTFFINAILDPITGDIINIVTLSMRLYTPKKKKTQAKSHQNKTGKSLQNAPKFSLELWYYFIPEVQNIMFTLQIEQENPL